MIYHSTSFLPIRKRKNGAVNKIWKEKEISHREILYSAEWCGAMCTKYLANSIPSERTVSSSSLCLYAASSSQWSRNARNWITWLVGSRTLYLSSRRRLMMDVLLFHLTTTTTIGLLLCFFPMAVDIQRRTADGEKEELFSAPGAFKWAAKISLCIPKKSYKEKCLCLTDQLEIMPPGSHLRGWLDVEKNRTPCPFFSMRFLNMKIDN